MNAETLSLIAGVVLSIGFSYMPGLKDWFNKKDPDVKRLIMLGVLLGVTLAIAGIACAGFAPDINLAVTCDRKGILELVQIFLSAVISNQATYMITPLFKKNKKVVPG